MASQPEPLRGESKEAVRQLFLDEGFARVGFTSAEPVADHISAWIAEGRHAGMQWIEREPEARAEPRRLLPSARSVICVGAAYPQARPLEQGPESIAAYARGDDYHRTMRAALERAVARLPQVEGRAPETRLCVDMSALLERALAARAGLGWIGRSTLLLDETHGPWMLLGEVLTDLPIEPDEAAVDRCGQCTACVEACPTDALDGDARSLDARRCLSYWTIEHRGPLPAEIGEALDGRAFGCDDCLTACPFPKTEAPIPASGPYEPRSDLVDPSHAELRARAEESFRRHFGTTPVERARKGGLLRNLDADAAAG